MSYFPMSVDLTGKTVILVGNGPQIGDKMEKLRPFGPVLRQVSTLSGADLVTRPAMVIAGDEADGEAVSTLCRASGVPVNVVDKPELCSFFFPAVIARGDVTVAVSTGGKSPAAAACLRQKIEAALPDRTEEILDWLARLRRTLPPGQRRKVLKKAAAQAFELERPLTTVELKRLF